MKYSEMTGPELLNELGDEADKWAAAFCEIAKTKGLEIDEGWMIGWFANAIEHSWDVRNGKTAIVLPDGSSFFVNSFRKKPISGT